MPDPEQFFDWRYARDFTVSELTVLAGKARLYALEPTYRETLYEVTRRTRSIDAAAELVRSTGLALFRPDAIARSKVGSCLDYFGRLGLRPGSMWPVPVGPAALRDVWRYQLDIASGPRLKLLDLIFGASASILCLFRPAPGVPPVPCTVIMADVKGRTNRLEREPWELRSRLGSPNRIEVYVHCSDEPADVVRDGGILLGASEFADGLTRSPHDAPADRLMRMAAELGRAYVRKVRLDAMDSLLRPAFAGDADPDEPGYADRLEFIRSAAARCVMNASAEGPTITDSGTYPWWAGAGLLDARARYLSQRTGWHGAAVRDPYP